MTGRAARVQGRETDVPAPVTPLELFFDLVFAFAISQVSAFIAETLSWHGLVRGLLLLALLWWSWVCYCWLGNVVKADEGVTRPVVFAAMAVMFVLALAIPEAFHDAPGGLSGPVVVAACYLAFRVLHLVLFWAAAGDDPGLRAQLVRFTPGMLTATVLLLVAAGTSGVVQTGLWAAAVAADYLGTLLIGAGGWRLRSVDHFAERHRRIVLVALGVSLAAVGAGVTGTAVSPPVVATAVLGFTLACVLWWTYFDVTAPSAQRAVAAVPVADRPRVARDAYSYLHLPLVGGIVLVTLGLRRVFAGPESGVTGALAAPLEPVALAGLLGGTVLYLLAAAGFLWRTTGRVGAPRLVTAGVLVLLTPGAATLPALAALALVAAVGAGLVVLERSAARRSPAGAA